MANSFISRKEKLIETGVYSEDDFGINLKGDLSERQRRMLLIFAYLWIGLAIINFLGILFFIYFLVLSSINFLIIFLIAVIFLSSNIYLCMQHAKPFWNDVQDDVVKTASGEITKKFFYTSTGWKNYNSYYTVRVNNIVFSVSPLLYYALEDGKTYRLFYVPNSKRVINIDTHN
ncbi:MAG: hypothetical protein JNK81_03215 [Anaerolineales bacterium]|nr:hypothetical protein [Anaerolineales bacterium]